MNSGINIVMNFFVIMLRRFVIVVFYMAILFAFLYSPNIVSYFQKCERTINVYTFTEFISSESIRKFELATGIKVRLQFFESNEELYAKFKINHGEGYDLITPSDFMVEIMHKNNLLQNIDMAKINNFKYLDERLLGKFFDPNNQYSVPICWLVYGIAYNKNLVGQDFKNVDLELLFKNPKDLSKENVVTKPFRICMIQDPREMIYLAALYLFGHVENLSEYDLAQIQDLLGHQKKWVESYTNVGIPNLLIGEVASVAVITSHQIKKLFEITNKFVFEIPSNGSLIAIENLAIPAKSKKSDLVHKFIDFLISEQISSMHAKMYGTNPSNKEAYKNIDPRFSQNQNFFPTECNFAKLHLIKNDIALEKVDSLWLAVRFY